MLWDDLKRAVDAAADPVDRRVLPTYASLVLTFTSQGIQLPVLPQLARSCGLGVDELGFVVGASALGRLCATVPAASLALRGRRPLLVAGPTIGMVAMASLSCGSSFVELAAANALLGVGMATTLTGAGLYLADVSTPRNRARTTLPLLQSALIGFSVGPAVGGLLSDSLGLRAPFVGCAIGLAGAAGAAYVLLPETLGEFQRRAPSMQQQQQQKRTAEVAGPSLAATTDALTLLRRPALQGLFAVTFCNGFAMGAMPVTTVMFATDLLEMSTLAVGGMFSAHVLMMACLSPMASRASDRVVNRKAIMVPALALTAGFAALSSLCTTPAAFVGCIGGCRLAEAFSTPSNTPYLLDNTSDDERAKAMAMRSMWQDSGTLLGASTCGIIAFHCGIPASMLSAAALQGAAALFFALRAPDGGGAGGSGSARA